MKITTELDITIPMTPNFIRIGNTGDFIPVAKLTNEQLQKIGEEWTRQLIDKANLRRKAGKV